MLVDERAFSLLLLTVSSPDFDTSETTQNIVEIPGVQELGICFGNFLTSRSWTGSTPSSQSRELWSGVSCEHQFILCFCILPCTLQGLSRRPCLSHSSHTPVRARLMTHPDKSSASALSQITSFAHPISQRFTCQ